MSAEIKLWHDCPACPNCLAKVGCPAAREERGRWYGSANSNLFCPACGTAWLGSAEEMTQALRAQQAWDRKLYVESGEQRLLDAVDRCLAIISDPTMHNAGKGSAVAELALFMRDGVRKARGER